MLHVLCQRCPAWVRDLLLISLLSVDLCGFAIGHTHVLSIFVVRFVSWRAAGGVRDRVRMQLWLEIRIRRPTRLWKLRIRYPFRTRIRLW